MPQLIKNLDEEQTVLKNSLFLPSKALPPTTTDCVPVPATTAVSFVPDEADSINTIPTVTVKNTPKRPQQQKMSATTATNYDFLLDFSKQIQV